LWGGLPVSARLRCWASSTANTAVQAAVTMILLLPGVMITDVMHCCAQNRSSTAWQIGTASSSSGGGTSRVLSMPQQQQHERRWAVSAAALSLLAQGAGRVCDRGPAQPGAVCRAAEVRGSLPGHGGLVLAW